VDNRSPSTAHLIELQSLFSLVNGEKADNQNELILYLLSMEVINDLE
jgi:hypothetical protein